MTWDTLTEVLDVESTLESRRKEATERCDEGSEESQHEQVQLVWRIGNGSDSDRVTELLKSKVSKDNKIARMD